MEAFKKVLCLKNPNLKQEREGREQKEEESDPGGSPRRTPPAEGRGARGPARAPGVCAQVLSVQFSEKGQEGASNGETALNNSNLNKTKKKERKGKENALSVI